MTTPKLIVLLVEDEDLVSMLTEDMLDSLGYEVAFSAATLEEGLEAAAHETFDVAILDVNLRGRMSFAIADILLDRSVPFIFASGYADEGIEPRFSGVATLQKPFTMKSLEHALLEALNAGSGSLHMQPGSRDI